MNSSTILAENSNGSSVTCIGCSELELKLRVKMSQMELKSDNKIVELLRKEVKQMEDIVLAGSNMADKLEETTTKFEVVSGGAVNGKSDRSQDGWRTMESKRYRNIGRNSELKRICTPYLPIITNNRYNALLNLMDYSSNEDVTSVIHGFIPAKKLNTPCVTEIAQSKRYRSGVLKKVNNRHRYDSANYQEVNTKPQNIPTIVNGYVSVSKDKKVFSFNNSKELYSKLLNSKNSLSKSSEHKVLLIGDSHLKGCSENMKIHVNDKFQVCGYIKPAAGVKGIFGAILKRY
jgi:hypothetical protein